jgi:hypothetical protein
VPMIVVCPACEAIVGFEIEMISRDMHGVIVPYSPGAQHPAISHLTDLVSQADVSPLGKVEQIALERERGDRSREAVLVQLARDVAVLRQLVGKIQSVSAAGPAMAIGRDPLGPKDRELPSLANLSVHLVGDHGLAARWSMGPALNSDVGRLTMIGQRGKAVLWMPAADPWSLEIAGQRLPLEATGQGEFESVFWQLGHAAHSDGTSTQSWLLACRDQEVAEAALRSLARGRTVELFNEEHTEEESFKGVMAIGGCLMLVFAMAVLLLATIVEGLRLPMRDWPMWRPWPFYLLLPIVAFLLLQLLQLAIKRDSNTTPLSPQQQEDKPLRLNLPLS